MAATYDPQSMVDVGMLRKAITDLTDEDGSGEISRITTESFKAS
jgi:hypothetical protein